MIDAVGNVGSVLLVGGTSDLGHALLARLMGPRLRRVVLAGRASEALDMAARRARAVGVPDVEIVPFDAMDAAGHEAAASAAFAEGDIDVAIMAIGWSPVLDPGAPNATLATRCIETNLAGSVSVGFRVAEAMGRQGHGVIVWFTAAAAALPSATDSVFAAANAGLDAFAVSLGEQMRGSGVHTVVVRVGHAPTKLGYGGHRGVPGAEPAEVAIAAGTAIRSRRSQIVYVPAGAKRACSRLARMPAAWRRRVGEP